MQDATFAVESSECLAIIGPNGAGKTTLFNLLSGQLKPTSGNIFYRGQDISGIPAHQRIQLGIGRSFQIAQLFNNLTVMENALLAVQGTQPSRFQLLRPITGNRQMFARAKDLLSYMDLLEYTDMLVSCIPHGAQRKLEIVLSMASDAKLLLLDEPSCGLTVAESAEITSKICCLKKDVTVMCVAHDMELVFGIATRIMVMHHGKIIIKGEPEKIRNDPTVKEIYLGTGKSV